MKKINALFIFFFTALTAQNLEDDLIFYYNFNDSFQDQINGINLTDYSLDNSGVIFSTVNESLSNKTVVFDGVSGVLQSPFNPITKVQFPFTLSGKINSSLGESVFLFRNDCDSNNYSGVILVMGATGKLGVHFGSNIGTSGPEARQSISTVNDVIIPDTWNQFTMIAYSETSVDFYVNCNKEATFNYGSGGALSYSDKNVGMQFGYAKQNNLPGVRYNGAIDEFALWSRALQESEIENICIADEISDIINDCNCVNDTIFVVDTIKITDTIKIIESQILYDTVIIYDTVTVLDTVFITLDLNNENDTIYIDSNTNLGEVRIYPNPTRNKINIQSEDPINLSDVKVLNSSGIEINVSIISRNSNKIEIDCTSLNPGIYFIIINNKTYQFNVS